MGNDYHRILRSSSSEIVTMEACLWGPEYGSLEKIFSKRMSAFLTNARAQVDKKLQNFRIKFRYAIEVYHSL